MPNYSQNSLRIKGNKEVIKSFLHFSKYKRQDGQPLDFSFQPYHSKLRNDKYDRDVWEFLAGTKWDANPSHLYTSVSGEDVTVFFETAWTPPIPMMLTWKLKFPTLNFKIRYWDEGNYFKGENGTMLDCEDDLKVDSDTELMWEENEKRKWTYLNFLDADPMQEGYKVTEMKGQF